MATNNKILNCPPLRFPEFSDEWTQTTLSEACSVIGGGTPSTDVDDYWNGDIQWFTPSEIGVNKFVSRSERTITEQGMNNSGAKLLPWGTVLLTTRATIGEASITTCPCTTNQGFQSLVINRDFTTTEFIYQKIETLKRELFSRANGSTFKEISASEVRSIPISLPSLAEQKKIADFLSLIDERIQCLSEIIKERKREKATLLNQLFSQKLRFPEFSDEWQETTLGEIGRTYNGLSGKSAEDFGDGFPYITYKMVYDDIKIDLTNVEYVRVSESESQSQVELGDILFTTSSETPEETGLCSVLLSSCDKLYLNSFCFGYRLNEENLAKSVSLGYALRSPIYRSKLSTLAQGSTRYNISKSEVMRMPISLPSLAEQKKIAEFLSLIDERIETEEELLKQYEAQKKYLLRQMFV